MTDPKIAVCIPLHRDVHADTMIALLALRFPTRPIFLTWRNLPVEASRNAITKRALDPLYGLMLDPEHAITHLLWLDGDMIPPPDALARLLAHDLPIVGGLYYQRGEPYCPLLMHDESDGGIRFEADPPPGLVQVDSTGGGFLLTKREVYEAISERLAPGEQWWDRAPVASMCGWPAEDIAFCRRARAAGFKVMVDCDCPIGHRGEITVTRDVAERLRRTPLQEHRHGQVLPAFGHE